MPVSTTTDARRVLAEQLAKGRTITEIAEEIGYKRPSLSLYLHDKYPSPSNARIEAAILNTFCDRIVCPHLASDIAQAQCADYRARPLPQSAPDELKHWLACQRCALNTSAREASHA